MEYEIFGQLKSGTIICYDGAQASEVDTKLKELKDKYPNVICWIFGIDLRLRTPEQIEEL